MTYAFQGAKKLITTEHSIMVQFSLGIVMIGLVLSVEGLNTAIEKIADFIHPNYHEKIGFIKDIAAGAVFFAAMTAIVIGLIIYVPIFF